jgi:hypothetical protein
MPTFEEMQIAFSTLEINPNRKDLERIIIDNPYFCYLYAKDVLKARFIIGEEKISKHAGWAYHYAERVIKGRFVLGEEAIFKSDYFSRKYKFDFLRNGH